MIQRSKLFWSEIREIDIFASQGIFTFVQARHWAHASLINYFCCQTKESLLSMVHSITSLTESSLPPIRSASCESINWNDFFSLTDLEMVLKIHITFCSSQRSWFWNTNFTFRLENKLASQQVHIKCICHHSLLSLLIECFGTINNYGIWFTTGVSNLVSRTFGIFHRPEMESKHWTRFINLGAKHTMWVFGSRLQGTLRMREIFAVKVLR